MGLQQSKDELLYQQVSYGTTEGIKSLRSEGAGLEWMDKEGKTPLILASMNPQLYDVAKTLIELGANVNAYRPGRHAGTPLHHAAKRGLEQMVKLLLSNGANALVLNDDCQTALDVARVKGYSNVVRAIENHICLFSGWLQELYGPGFLELLAPQLLSRKVWVVILPCGARKLTTPFKLELAIYSGLQDAKPRTIIALWKANMDEPNFNQSDPAVIISSSNIPRRWRRKRCILSSQVRQSRVKLAPVNENEKQQLQRFCNACKGIPQVIHASFPFNNQGADVEGPAQTTPEDADLALAISASLQSASGVRPVPPNTYPGSGSSTSAGWTNSTSQNSETATHNGKSKWEIHDVGTSSTTTHYHPHTDTNTYSQIVPTAPITPPSVPSAPPVSDMVDDGPIHYPTIDSTPMDLSSSVEESRPAAKAGEKEKDNNDSSSCVICLDAPVEGACIPCGHMAGCMSCLNEVKGKNWGCPVCRTKIDQVVRLYAV
ncbi:putative E3 ubiquitin-protein ligase XBAT35 isoform X1 [Cynara cardunculus var. scolymus]|uniref:Ankyrin repeat-containing protein n=1 Tax=Cynara cardunculus var. scolymus TaxID=59895 RepID=A0A103XIQ5_CYNCS|nr:putative E3 ubiquitin-protein ligase XBAT35 isoform X1 [Cynara cardunculus var. scolymus]KVH91505.1 Ankyrin repeat-containing protein [Cynara cardunculus var. scolymus]